MIYYDMIVTMIYCCFYFFLLLPYYIVIKALMCFEHMIQRVVVLFPNSETITRQNGYLIGKVMINRFGFGA